MKLLLILLTFLPVVAFSQSLTNFFGDKKRDTTALVLLEDSIHVSVQGYVVKEYGSNLPGKPSVKLSYLDADKMPITKTVKYKGKL